MKEENLEKSIWLDTETTGLSYLYDELLQVSIIDYQHNILFDSYIRPKRVKRWPDAEAVNHITPAMVQGYKTIDGYLPRLQEIVDGAEIIGGYNTCFDLDFLRQAGITRKGQKIIDVMADFAPIYGEWSDWFQDYKWQKLEVCARYYNYQFKAHNSLADIEATLYCYEKMRYGADH